MEKFYLIQKKKNFFKVFYLLFFLLIINYYYNYWCRKTEKQIEGNVEKIKYLNYKHLISYDNYINDCRLLIKYNNRTIIKNEYPYFSICLCTYNLDKYIERSILSILNQSYQNFEIIIVNDCSIDNTSNILLRLQSNENRIKIVNHNKNLGIYHSRVDAILNSNGKYILFLDPDDMFFNQYLLEILFIYNLDYNLDIIEYSIYYLIENKNKIFYPKLDNFNHYHNFSKKIIFQPELSNILFYKPNTKRYSSIICRTIWNKIYRKENFLKSIKYIGEDYYQQFYINAAEDTLLNLINFHFAFNYSNINISGYIYNLRDSSISHRKRNRDENIYRSISFYYYFKLLYKFIKEFNKDINYLYYELKDFVLI